mgnify:CR=1 FL=1
MTNDTEDLQDTYPGAGTFKFGDNAKLCQHLIALVRQGKKTATCAALSDFDGEPEAMPVVGRCDIAANWDLDYTGPVSGTWMIVPGPCHMGALDDPYTFWAGTYTGKREVVPDFDNPSNPLHVKWITTLKFVGIGMGDLAGQKIKATEVITTFSPVPVPWELVPFVPADGPEGEVDITIITKY